MAKGSTIFYPPVGFHFEVKLLENDSKSKSSGKSDSSPTIDGSFQEVSGISVQIESEDLYEGGENRFVYKLPKGIRYTPLLLKRGLVASGSALGEWCQETFTYGFEQPILTRDVLVSLLDEENSPLMSWVFIRAYPTKWDISSLNAQNNEIVVENLELTYQRFEVVK